MEEMKNETFVIDTDAKAAWALSKIKAARDERDNFIEWYEAKIKEIKEQTDANTSYLEGLLMNYFATVPHKNTKTQASYSLPGGKLILKKQAPEFKRNDAAVIEWLKANNGAEYVKVTESLDWAGLKAKTAVFDGQLVTEDGEIIPGVDVVERPDKFIVEVGA